MAEDRTDESTRVESTREAHAVWRLPVKHRGMASRAAELVTLARVLEKFSNREVVDSLLDAVMDSLILNDMLLAVDARNPSEFTPATWSYIERIERAARDARRRIRSSAVELGIEL